MFMTSSTRQCNYRTSSTPACVLAHPLSSTWPRSCPATSLCPLVLPNLVLSAGEFYRRISLSLPARVCTQFVCLAVLCSPVCVPAFLHTRLLMSAYALCPPVYLPVLSYLVHSVLLCSHLTSPSKHVQAWTRCLSFAHTDISADPCRPVYVLLLSAHLYIRLLCLLARPVHSTSSFHLPVFYISRT